MKNTDVRKVANTNSHMEVLKAIYELLLWRKQVVLLLRYISKRGLQYRQPKHNGCFCLALHKNFASRFEQKEGYNKNELVRLIKYFLICVIIAYTTLLSGYYVFVHFRYSSHICMVR